MTISGKLKYSVCQHHWSFLEGETSHSRKLKAGRHVFPFQLELGGSLPSTAVSDVLGGFSLTYELRAIVTRHGLYHGFETTVPVRIVRSLSPEALEYQQSHEIEGTWSDRIVYSIKIPHKAWAVEDAITTHIKLWPLEKGISVLHVITNLRETTKVHNGFTILEDYRDLVETGHDVVDGKLVPSGLHTAESGSSQHFLLPYRDRTTRRSSANQLRASRRSSAYNPHSRASSDAVDVLLTIPIPSTASATHTHGPVATQHIIYWCIVLRNSEGQRFTLRCSLPIHLLDSYLLDEARSCTALTRRLNFGQLAEIPFEEEAVELPTYNAHLRDPVATILVLDAPVANQRPESTPHETGVGLSQRTAVTLAPIESHMSRLSDVLESGRSSPLERPASSASHTLNDHTSPRLRKSEKKLSPGATKSTALSRCLRRLKWCSKAVRQPGNVETFLHTGHTTQQLPSIFKSTMATLPFYARGRMNWFSSSSRAPDPPRPRPRPRPVSCAGLPAAATAAPITATSASPSSSTTRRQSLQPISMIDHVSDAEREARLRMAFTEVPDYNVASRDFIGGIPPLSSLNGLPSYAEA
jgi:arrestin-related trafficking adapter 4/5/7